jgi:hypothetical protein
MDRLHTREVGDMNIGDQMKLTAIMLIIAPILLLTGVGIAIIGHDPHLSVTHPSTIDTGRIQIVETYEQKDTTGIFNVRVIKVDNVEYVVVSRSASIVLHQPQSTPSSGD